MTVTNKAIGEQINLATVLNTKLESPILQTEMGLNAQATANGHAVRYDEWTKRHNNDGTVKQKTYKKTTVANPSATANTYGTAINLTPDVNYTALVPLAVDIVFGGTFGAETATATIVATFSDTTTASIDKTATGTGTSSLTNADLMALAKDGVYVTQLSVKSKSTIASSAATVTFNHMGLYL